MDLNHRLIFIMYKYIKLYQLSYSHIYLSRKASENIPKRNTRVLFIYIDTAQREVYIGWL